MQGARSNLYELRGQMFSSVDGRSCGENIVDMVDLDDENFASSRWV